MQVRRLVIAVACVLPLFVLPHLASSQQPPSSPPVPQATSTAPRVPMAAINARAQAAPPSAFEQFTLTGVVLDGNGKPVKGAEVTLVDPDTNFKATPAKTDKKGVFTFSNLTNSSYRLQARKGDHQSDTVDVAIGSAKTVHKNLVLK